MTKRTIYLHIGFEKTGTTSIQNYLYNNVDKLNDLGVFLIQTKFFLKPNHVELATCFCEDYNIGALRKPRSISRFLGRIKCFILENKDRDIIFSNEHLSSRLFEEDNIRALKDFLSSALHRVIVICYVRKPADWLVSRYSEAVKSGFSGTLDQFVRMDKPVTSFEPLARNLAGRLQVWRNVFCDDLIVCDFEEAIQVGLVNHFISNVLQVRLFPDVSVIKNTSLSYEQIELLSFINKFFGFSVFGRVIRKPLVYLFNRVKFGRPLLEVVGNTEFGYRVRVRAAA